MRGEERGTQGGVRGDGSSDVEIIERGQYVDQCVISERKSFKAVLLIQGISTAKPVCPAFQTSYIMYLRC